MIEMKCPACGAEGRAPKEKVNTRLVCRKCLKVFHLTPTGRAVLGEPPVTGTTSTAPPHSGRSADPTQSVDEWFDRASKAAFTPKSLAIAGGLVLLTLILAFFSLRRPRAFKIKRRGWPRPPSRGTCKPFAGWPPPAPMTKS